jgi:hypothetical protein
LRSVHERWSGRFRTPDSSNAGDSRNPWLISCSESRRPCWLRSIALRIAAGDTFPARLPAASASSRLRLSPRRSQLRPPREVPKQSGKRSTTGELVTTGPVISLWSHRAPLLRFSQPFSTPRTWREPCVPEQPALERPPWHVPGGRGCSNRRTLLGWVVQ